MDKAASVSELRPGVQVTVKPGGVGSNLTYDKRILTVLLTIYNSAVVHVCKEGWGRV